MQGGYMQSPKIETKNLTIIEDQATQEMVMSKKMEHYSTQLTDQQAKNMATELARNHRNHFDNLLNYLNSHG